MAARAALVVVSFLLLEQWSLATKTTEQSRDDTHYVPSDPSLPVYIQTYPGQLKLDQIINFMHFLNLQP